MPPVPDPFFLFLLPPCVFFLSLYCSLLVLSFLSFFTPLFLCLPWPFLMMRCLVLAYSPAGQASEAVADCLAVECWYYRGGARSTDRRFRPGRRPPKVAAKQVDLGRRGNIVCNSCYSRWKYRDVVPTALLGLN